MKSPAAFARLVSDAMTSRGLGLRELCRRAGCDPSFLSKVLAGKRHPPSDEAVLRQLARALELDPVEVIVAAGRIPTDWKALWDDADLLRVVHAAATGGKSGVARTERVPPAARPAAAVLSEELL